MIRKASADDAASIADIYNFYVQNSIATFDTEDISMHDMKMEFERISVKHPFLVMEEEREVIGYAYGKTWNSRKAYDKTAEVSIYFHPEKTGNGRGKALYEELFNQLNIMGLHTLIAGVSLPNDVSVKFHESFGFEKVAHFKEVGYKFDRWIDVAYWQKYF